MANSEEREGQPVRDSHAHVVYKPVIRRAKGGEGDVADKPPTRKYDPYLRSENEDDDGYDPYSDRREEPPLFESDPWL